MTNLEQTVVAGQGIKNYDPRFEVVMDTEEEWYKYINGYLGSRNIVISRGHILSVLLTIPPSHDNGANQGLGDEDLGSVFTQIVIDQFAANNDLSALPYVEMNGVRYPVLPPFGGYPGNNTFNRPQVNPYAQD
jgi:hypothetical protein